MIILLKLAAQLLSDCFVVTLKGKGVDLARYIQSLQRSKSVSGFSRPMSDQCLTSGYISDESDDSSFSAVSMDDSLFMNDEIESDGKFLLLLLICFSISHKDNVSKYKKLFLNYVCNFLRRKQKPIQTNTN